MVADAAAWGSCRFCGTAVAPGASACGICGADRPVPAGALPGAPVAVRRRIALAGWLRALIVVGVAVGLAWTLVDAVITGPPNVADPLTTSGTYRVAPGVVAFAAGEVTGGDYVVGNFTSLVPHGAEVSVSVYNASQWSNLLENGSGTPVWSTPSEGSGRIVFTSLYTDNYSFVLSNPYAPGTGPTISVYVQTQYESNVGNDGFG
ncbi:MAG TPA: emp24/gp25L/p24 family protein [Thermoplasmata archaeon]|nr:emp24/gp25L/p24 family protein [Thermoplasmata archaeon]